MVDVGSSAIVVAPRIDVDPRLEDANVFAYTFASLTPEEWVDILVQSIDKRIIDGVEFPGFPSAEFQSQLHGHFGRHSLYEAAQFYSFVRQRGLTGPAASYFGTGYLLDFGAGWGRITRMFMRDFPLRNIIGYEPSNRYCSVARGCNPFVSFLSGGYLPDGVLPAAKFDLVVGWSVFSHLSLQSASAWLREMERVTKPGGAVVMTTWGRRFLDRLAREQALLLAGEEIHWYSKVCLAGIGDVAARVAAFEEGDFVWFTSGGSSLYGEAFVSEAALGNILREYAPRMLIEEFDAQTLPQDVFVLRKT